MPMYWTGTRWTNMDTYEDLFGEVKEWQGPIRPNN